MNAVIIPCYNQEKVWNEVEYTHFLSRSLPYTIIFVNDSSTDTTQQLIENLYDKFPTQIVKISLPQNVGKAEAIRIGVTKAISISNVTTIGFLDADLATPWSEYQRLTTLIYNSKTFVFGSRFLKIGSVIERRFSRFMIGRVIATIISSILQLKVYDTQCGAKVFSSNIAIQIFDKPFTSKWLFDVELFYRMYILFGKEKAVAQMHEEPLLQWKEKGDSKVSFFYGFKVWTDLWKIKKRYNKEL